MPDTGVGPVSCRILFRKRRDMNQDLAYPNLIVSAALADASSLFSSKRIGEIDAARPAGMRAAKNAQVASDVAATASASGSQNDTP